MVAAVAAAPAPAAVPPSGGGSHTAFARRALEAASVGAGLTHDQVSGDLTAANYSSLRAGKIEFRTDAGANVHAAIGKRSFSTDDLVTNLTAFLDHLRTLRPPQAKGSFLRKVVVSTTMGPGVALAVE